MTLHDYYLRTENQHALESALANANLITIEDGEIWLADGVNLDIIGQIPESTDDEVPTYKPGYRANLRLTFPLPEDHGLPLIVAPETPYRVWQLPPNNPTESSKENKYE